jgi:hypothetical protein
VFASFVGFKQDRNFLEFADREKMAEAPRVALA